MNSIDDILKIFEKIMNKPDDETIINQNIDNILQNETVGINVFKKAVKIYNENNPNTPIPKNFIDHYLSKYDKQLDSTVMSAEAIENNQEIEKEDIDEEGDDVTTYKSESDIHEEITEVSFKHDDETVLLSPTADENKTITPEDITTNNEATQRTIPTDGDFTTHTPPDTTPTLGIGSVIKGRFKIEKLLGVGGMGRVYKALDLIKHEAQNKQPYVAIKLLTDEFKKHANSFIILEREASKSQRLAHPNIGTVFDFDRDSTGTIYITMEMLDGMELKQYIRKNIPKNKGRPIQEMWSIIEGLADALGYAHKNNLIHSDFKPGNAFLSENPITHQQVIKVIDFGISRASGTGKKEGFNKNKKAGDNESTTSDMDIDISDSTIADNGESTLFDPSSMNALTPAYASFEMHVGREPDQADDIYALGCTCYELLAGVHPYKKKTAVQVIEKNIQPPSLEATDLTLLQKKTLEKSIKIYRKDRVATIDEFLEGMRPRQNHTKSIISGSLLSLTFLSFMTYSVYASRNAERQNNLIIANLSSQEEVRIAQGFNTLITQDESTNLNVPKILSQSRKPLLSFLKTKTVQTFNPSEDKYSYPEAIGFLNRVGSYYSDSSEIKDLRANIIATKHKIVFDELIPQKEEAIKKKQYFTKGNKLGLQSILEKTFLLDPNNSVIIDEDIVETYKLEIDTQIEKKNYVLAKRIAVELTKYLPNNSAANEISFLTNIAEKKYNNEILINSYTVEELIEGIAEDEISSFVLDVVPLYLSSEFNAFPDNTLLQNAIIKRYASLNKTKQLEFLDKYPRLFTVKQFVDERTSLTEKIDSSDTFQSRLKILNEEILSNPYLDFTNLEYKQEYLTSFKNMIYYAESQEQVDLLNQKYQEAIDEQFKKILADTQFYRAEALIAIAEDLFGNQGAQYVDLNNQLVNAKSAYEFAEAQRIKDITIDRKYRYLDTALGAKRIVNIENSYQELKKLVGVNETLQKYDKDIAVVYADNAEIALEKDNITLAKTLLDTGSKYSKNNSKLSAVRKALDTQLQIRNLLVAITELNSIDENTVKRIKSIVVKDTKTNRDFDIKMTRHVLRTVETLKRNGKILSAWNLRDSAISIFPQINEFKRLTLPPKPKPAQYASLGLSKLDQGLILESTKLLQQAKEVEPNHPHTAELDNKITSRKNQALYLFQQYESFLNQRNVEKASESINQVVSLWSDNPIYIQAKTNQSKYAGLISKGARICFSSYKGHGKRNAICNDVIITKTGEKKAGPLLVVLPENLQNKFDLPIVIGKYEVSVAEFNLYCQETGDCQVNIERDERLPVVDVTPNKVENYLKWLSEVSGYQYRLPTYEEWRYGASANDREENQDYNCLSSTGGRIIKGQAVTNSSSGNSNRWGLINYVGNVDDLITSDKGYLYAGGNRSDPYLRCNVNLLKDSSSDQYNPSLAGFRVLRSLF